VIAANVTAMRAAGDSAGVARYGNIQRAIVDDASLPDAAVYALAMMLQVTSERLKIPKLREFGMTERDVPEMVALARKASSMKFNPVLLSDEALAGALRAAI
jgi:alcohol dehydrogenase class IV